MCGVVILGDSRVCIVYVLNNDVRGGGLAKHYNATACACPDMIEIITRGGMTDAHC